MNDSINLLRGKNTKKYREEKILRIIKIISVVFLCVVGVISGILFFMQTNVPIEAVRAEELSQRKLLDQYQEAANKLFISRSRIKDITAIVDKRELLDTVLGDLRQGIPENVNIETLSLDGKNFSLTINSSSLTPLETVIASLIALTENKKIFTKITLEGLSVDPEEDEYTMSLSGNLP